MMDNFFIKMILPIAIPVAGSIGYMHGVFATKYEITPIQTAVKRVDKLICKMAILQKLDSAERICTED